VARRAHPAGAHPPASLSATAGGWRWLATSLLPVGRRQPATVHEAVGAGAGQ